MPGPEKTVLLTLWYRRYYVPRLSLYTVGKPIRRCAATRPAQRHADASSDTIMTNISDNRPQVRVVFQDRVFAALIDTGASKSYMGDILVEQCRHSRNHRVIPTVSNAKVANGQISSIKEAYRIKLKFGSQTVTEVLNYLPQLASDIVIGMDILRKYRFTVNLQSGTVFMNEEILSPPPSSDVCSPIEDTNDTAALVLTAEEEAKLKTFLEHELPLFAAMKGTTPLIEHRIQLLDPEPIKQRYRPQNPKMQSIINAEVDKMLEDGIIEPSDTPWSSPIVMVRKKDGSFRFCVDFKLVNASARKDAYPLPYINSILDKLRKARYISSIDLKQGYWQIPLAAESRPITGFTVPSRGLFHFKVMPFGLHSAPATFQRLMDKIIGPEMDPYCFAYLDDIIVLGETFDEHLANLQEVFHRLRAANLKLNPDKCQFGRRSLKYLGHMVTSEGIHTDPDKVAAIQELPPPTTVRSLRRFLGIASWYRRFVPGFSQIAAPLNRLLKKGIRWVWTNEQDDAFNRLKSCLTKAPVLTCPDFQRPFVLQTDASDAGLGVALIQHDQDGDHVIAYASRTLTSSEKKYSVTEKECLAIVWGIEKMRPYLEGYRFTVLSDHQSLRWLHSLKSPSGRLARWSIFLQQYDFEIKYRKGVLNRVADALSRQPLLADEAEEVDPLLVLGTEESCSWYTKKKKEVEQNPAAFPDFCIRNDRLYRHFWDSHDLTEPDMADPWKLCVPKTARQTVLQENHDAPTAGHMGIAKTTARIALRYYWPGMFRDIAQYVRKCPSCQKYKSSQQQVPGKMQPSRNQSPWETVSTDLVGPLPRSSKGNSYLVVFQDRFTKWIECKPIRKATAAAVSQALHGTILARFGRPVTLISDNGTQFTGKIFKDLLRNYGIQHRLTPPYTPQANPVERANKTMKTMIAQFCEENHKKWDDHLPDLIFAYNTSRNDTTGFTPAFLNFGRELEPPKSLYSSEIPTGSADDKSNEPPADATNELIRDHSDRLNRLRDVYELVRVNLARAFTVQSRHYNLRRRDWRCRVGDKVMKREHHLSSAEKNFAAKLAPKYSGPYTVVKVLSPVVYDMKNSSGKVLRRFHIKDLKPAY